MLNSWSFGCKEILIFQFGKANFKKIHEGLNKKLYLFSNDLIARPNSFIIIWTAHTTFFLFL